MVFIHNPQKTPKTPKTENVRNKKLCVFQELMNKEKKSFVFSKEKNQEQDKYKENCFDVNYHGS